MIPLVLFGLLAIQDPDIDMLLIQLSSADSDQSALAFQALAKVADQAEEKVRKLRANAQGRLRMHCDMLLRSAEALRKLPLVVPRVKLVTLDVKDEPLDKVLDRFAAQAGWRPFMAACSDSHAVAVTVQFKNATPLEALDSICRSAGLDFDVCSESFPFDQSDGPKPNLGIRITGRGKTRAPQAFIRNYRVQGAHVSLTQANHFTHEGKGCQAAINIQWSPDVAPDEITWQPVAVVDDQGRNLYDPKSYMRFIYRAERRERDSSEDNLWSHELRRGWELRYPEPDAKSIASLKGRVSVMIRTDLKYVEFKDPEKHIGEVLKHEGLAIRLKECRREGDRLFVTVQAYWDGPSGEQYSRRNGDQLIAFRDIDLNTKSDEAILRSEDFDQSGETIRGRAVVVNTFRLSYRYFNGPVQTVRVLVDSLNVCDHFDFELKDIPLPK